VQLAAHPRLERLVAGLLGGARRDRRRIFGMEVAAPVHVVAQELDDQAFQQRVVFAVRPEEARVEGIAANGIGRRVRMFERGGIRAHAAHDGERDLHGQHPADPGGGWL
jgi:hypothetical protein